ncbi:unnamed protein product [Effrenium voratum]|nr:unnamed protein product [Effrenium voratum]
MACVWRSVSAGRPRLCLRHFAEAASLTHFETLLQSESGAQKAAKWALENRKLYKDNKVAWQPLLSRLSGADASGKEFGHLQKIADVQELIEFVTTLAEEAHVTQSSFWEKVTQGTRLVYTTETSLEANLELARLYSSIGAWHQEVFQAVFETVEVIEDERGARREKRLRYSDIYSMEVRQLVLLLAIFGRAGAAARELSFLATRAFNEARLRFQEEDPQTEWLNFRTDDMLSIIDSMARFSTKNNEPVLRKFGRERLHPELLQLGPAKVASLCSAYASLRWKHDTVFKEVLSAMSEEQEQVQRDRVLGVSTQETIKYGCTEMALVADAMLVLRMYRGNNDWFRWGENFQQLMDVLARRLETGEELQTMAARPLACAAYALGRAKKGSETLCQAMLARMMTLLEKDQADPDGTLAADEFREGPQDSLERFMFGLAMMGPSKRKEFLNTEWLREWICNNYYKLSLQDIVKINRYLVQIRSFDQAYLEVFVDFFIDNMEQLGKSDVQDLTHTYNHARLGEEALGRHFFWALGRQFQRQHVKRVSQKRGRARPALERIG